MINCESSIKIKKFKFFKVQDELVHIRDAPVQSDPEKE
jgi:hypothetical protein